MHGVKEHESYRGDRTQASLLAFADNLAPSAGQPHHYIRRAPHSNRPLPQVASALRVMLWSLWYDVGCKGEGLCRASEDLGVGV